MLKILGGLAVVFLLWLACVIGRAILGPSHDMDSGGRTWCSIFGGRGDSSAERARARRAAFLAGPPAGAWDAATYGRPCANPFLDVPPSMEDRWAERGLDLDALRKLEAVRLEGHYYGAGMVNFVNKYPSVVLVIGSPFGTHGSIHSDGPVVVLDNAVPGDLNGSGVVWFRDTAFPRGLTHGKPVLLEPSANHGQMQIVDSVIHQGPFTANAGPKDAWLWKRLRDADIETVARVSDRSYAKPFHPSRQARLADLVDERRLAALERAHPGARGMRAVLLGPADRISTWSDVVQADPDAVLVIETGCDLRGNIFAAGPVVTHGQVNTGRMIMTKRWYDCGCAVLPPRVMALE